MRNKRLEAACRAMRTFYEACADHWYLVEIQLALIDGPVDVELPYPGIVMKNIKKCGKCSEKIRGHEWIENKNSLTKPYLVRSDCCRGF